MIPELALKLHLFISDLLPKETLEDVKEIFLSKKVNHADYMLFSFSLHNLMPGEILLNAVLNHIPSTV